MTRLFYQIEGRLYFDQSAFNHWAQQLGLMDPVNLEQVKIEWIDRNGLIHVN